MPRVLVAGALHPSGLAVLEHANGLNLEYIEDQSTEAMLPHLSGADAVLLRMQRFDEDVVAQAPELKIVSRHGVGYDAVDTDALAARGITLCTVGDVTAQPVAEHAMMLMLAASHRLVEYHKAARGGDWGFRGSLSARGLSGKTLLIIGLGRIGRQVAKMAQGFSMRVLAVDPYASGVDGVEMVSLDDGLRAADAVTLHMPGGDGVILGAKELALLKPGAVVVNTARGGLIDETALLDALGQGVTAGLDVFETEPLPETDLLRSAPGVVLTPHCASLTAECAEAMAVQSAQNIVDFFAGTLDPAMVVRTGRASD